MARGIPYLLVQFFLVFLVNSSFCQINVSNNPVDSLGQIQNGSWNIEELITEVLDSNSIQALKESNILADFSAEDLEEYKILFKSDTLAIAQRSKSNFWKKFPKVELAVDQRAIKNYSQDANAPWLNLSYVHLNTSTKINKVPVNINLTGALIDDEFNWNLSGFNFDFDQRKFLEGMVQDKAKDRLSGKVDEFKEIKSGNVRDIFSARLPNTELPSNPFDSKSVDVLKNELKFKLLKYIISHPKFREKISETTAKKDSIIAHRKNQALTKKDSLEQKKGELNNQLQERRDSLNNMTESTRNKIDSLRNSGKRTVGKIPVEKMKDPEKATKEVYDKLFKEYKSSWEERKKYYGDSLINFKKKLLKVNPDKELKNLPIDSLKTMVDKMEDKSGLEKILAAFNKINLGRTVISDHWFLGENLSLIGAMAEFETKNYQFSAAAGAQRFDYSILPILGFALPKQLPDRKFLYASVQYEKEDSYSLRFSNLNSKESSNEFSTGVPIARDNNVFLLSGSTPIPGGLELLVDLAYSRTQGRFQPVSEADPNDKTENGAGEVKLAYPIPKTNFSINAGGFYIGANYLSIGNPFLRSGQKGVTFGLTGTLFNRLSINANMRKGKTIGSVDENLQRDDLTFNGSATLSVTKNLTISASAFPNFTSYQLNESYDVNANLWATTYDIQYSVSGKNITTTNSLSYTNSVNQLVLQDSTDLSNYDGLIYYGNLTFLNGFGLEFLAMGWSNLGIRNNGIPNKNFQASLLYTKDKINLRSGIIYGTEESTCEGCAQGESYGFSAGFDLQLFKKMKIGFDSRLPLVKPKTQHGQRAIQEYISTNMSYKF